MAHFAELGADNVVLRIIVFDGEGEAGEAACADFMARAEGAPPSVWKQTSYSGAIRGCFAGIGYTYDSGADVFTPPAPESSEEP